MLEDARTCPNLPVDSRIVRQLMYLNRLAASCQHIYSHGMPEVFVQVMERGSVTPSARRDGQLGYDAARHDADQARTWRQRPLTKPQPIATPAISQPHLH